MDAVRPLGAALAIGIMLAVGVLVVRTMLTSARGRATDARAHLVTVCNAYLALLVTILLWPKHPFARARPLRLAFHEFWTWPPKLNDFTLNIVLLLPLGALVYLLYRWKGPRALWMLAIPYVAEVLQAIVGQLHRASTAADMLAYTVGIALGSAACALAADILLDEVRQ